MDTAALALYPSSSVHVFQIPPEEYHAAVQHLMLDPKFRCHVWCYNVPAAIVFFMLFLGACLAVIPLLESRLIFQGAETGLEFVHGGILWLCALTAYMVVVLVAKRQVRRFTYLDIIEAEQGPCVPAR